MNGTPGPGNYRSIDINTVEQITTCGITAEVESNAVIDYTDLHNIKSPDTKLSLIA